MPHGGRRPGAGAPRGNLNALKTGRYSRRLRTIAKALGMVPEVSAILLEFERRQHRQQRKAARLAHRALLKLFTGQAAENNPFLAYLRPPRGNTENRDEKSK